VQTGLYILPMFFLHFYFFDIFFNVQFFSTYFLESNGPIFTTISGLVDGGRLLNLIYHFAIGNIWGMFADVARNDLYSLSRD